MSQGLLGKLLGSAIITNYKSFFQKMNNKKNIPPLPKFQQFNFTSKTRAKCSGQTYFILFCNLKKNNNFIIIKLMQDQQQYEVIIIECCENCESHQGYSRHSEWKYFEQFNELKRKIERYVNGAIVIKNPIPDELKKTQQLKGSKNTYVNRKTDQVVTFPRVGAFQVYIYNVLIFSKLLTNNWPNHYKLLQLINKIIEENKKGNKLDEFSVYRQELEREDSVEKERGVKGTSKKKKDYRVYKSKDKEPLQTEVRKKKTLEPVSLHKKKNRRTLLNQGELLQEQVKLPSLNKTINFSKQLQEERKQQQQKQQKQGLKKIFNSIEAFPEQHEISYIKRNESLDGNRYQNLEFEINDSMDMNSIKHQPSLKFLEEKSVQYSDPPDEKDYMNQSIQYEEEEGYHCDFSVQIDDGRKPQQLAYNYVQTDHIDIVEQKQEKQPYMLDEEVQANIIIPVPQEQISTQTPIPEITTTPINTDIVNLVSRSMQYPEEEVAKPVTKSEFRVIDDTFQHLYEKRRNIIDNQYYSVDRFEEKNTKYKWVGRARQTINIDQLRKEFLTELMVLSVYGYFGIKSPEKRLSYQSCSNIQAQEKSFKKTKEALVHVMSSENPEIQFITNFEELDPEDHKYPLSEQLTFKNSKQKVKFKGYGALLAIAYFLGDWSVFTNNGAYIGLVISNQQVKQIYKMSVDGYQINGGSSLPKNRRVIIDRKQELESIGLSRLSEKVELEFIGMISKLLDVQVFSNMMESMEQIFIHLSASENKSYRMALLSMRTEMIDKQLVEEFMSQLQNRYEYLKKEFKGEVYAYRTYGSLNPTISFNLEASLRQDPSGKKQSSPMHIQRKFRYEDKIVMNNDVIKHIRSKDNLVLITAPDGYGKTTFLNHVMYNLKHNFPDKIQLWQLTPPILTDPPLMKKTVSKIIDGHQKQVIVVDDGEHYTMQIVQFVEMLYGSQEGSLPEISICVGSSSEALVMYQSRFLSYGLKLVLCEVMGLDIQEIRNYMSKNIIHQNLTDKQSLMQQVLGGETVSLSPSHPKYPYISLLQNPFYLHLYCRYLSHLPSIEDFESCLLYSFNKYTFLREIYNICGKRQKKQLQQMELHALDVGYQLKKIAFQYWHHNKQITDTIKDIVDKYQTDTIITNQLSYYPINVDALVKRQKSLFAHQEYFKYFLVEAYCYFIERGYRSMNMNKIYNNIALTEMLREHYETQKSHDKLLHLIYQSKSLPNTAEQASQAMTLLVKLNYTFTNLNFDEVSIPDADLSMGVFYHTSFRNANLNNAILYKTQLVSCTVEGAKMDNINLYERKIQSQYTVLAVAISMDGRQLAMGCGNYLIIVNTETGKEIKKIQAHVDIIRSVKYSKDNSTLITIADDKTLRIWDTKTYRSVVFRLPQKGTIAFSNESETIASVAKNYLKIWNIKSMANEFVLEGHSDMITCVSFSMDGSWVLTGSRDTTIKLWSIKQGKLLNTYRGHTTELINAKVSPNKDIIVSCSKDNDLVVWDAKSRSQIMKKTFQDQVVELCLDDQQKYVVFTFSKQNYIYIADSSNLQIIHILPAHKSRIISIQYDAFYQNLVSLARDRTIKVWKLHKILEQEEQSFKNSKHKKVKSPITVLTYCKFTSKYATGHENGEINLYSGEDDRWMDQVMSEGPVRCLVFDKLGKMYGGGADGTVRIWNLQSRRQPKKIQIHSSEMIELKLSQKNRLIATSSQNNQLVVYDITGIRVVMSTREEGRVHSIEFSKDEKVMAVGGTEKYIALYEVSDGGNTVSRMQELGPNADTVSSMTFYSDSLLIVALKNGHAIIWNYMKASLIKKIQHNSQITSIKNFQKKYIYFASQDGRIRLIDMEEGKEIKVFRYSEVPVSFSINAEQNILYMGTKNNNIIKWNLNSIYPAPERLSWRQMALDQEGDRIVEVQSGKQILIRNLHFHEEQHINIPQLSANIEGVSFHRGKIILLLKNGIHWEVGKGQYHFGRKSELSGDLHYVKDKNKTIFFKTPLHKLKGLKKPTQGLLEQLCS